ncbi:MAG TPA: hypothetical protein VKX17_17500 [Planctomycetota bacterium]|nr:hypothetical protein [Planctomycetota bacterium]
MLKLASFFGTILCASLAVAFAAEEPKPAQSGTNAPASNAKREEYSDPEAGYSLLLPAGYRKLSDDEMHFVTKSLSEQLGKDAEARAIKRLPTYFLGPVDFNSPKDKPPSLTILFTENDRQIDPADIPAIKQQLEEQQKREREKAGDYDVKLVKVDGINSLQVEFDVVDPNNNNERNRMIRVAVPAKGKWFEMLFNYSPGQSDTVHAALKETLDSFKVMEHRPTNIANQNKWLRVLYYTIGFGLVGIVLSMLLQRRKPAQAKR